jgi:bleomycin hydrolase
MEKAVPKKEQGLSLTDLKDFRSKFYGSSGNKMAQNALSRTEGRNVALKWDAFANVTHVFSHVVSSEMGVTNQQKSGRCWLFAALNLLRLKLAKKYKLEKFEFSQTHLFFWDKIEKANYFLESILTTGKEPLDSRLMAHLLNSPVQDGGQWHMFQNLVEKYGLVPQSVYPDSQGALNSQQMNYYVTHKLREDAYILRTMMEEGKTPALLEKAKKEMMEEIYRIVAIHLGTPPETFTWTFRDKEKKYHTFPNETPHSFYKNHVHTDLDDYVCLIHSPRKATPYYKAYTVAHLGNVWEGKPILYINVPMEDMKKAVVDSLTNDESVWFGCDVGKWLDREIGVMDRNLFDFESLFSVSFGMNKETRINYFDSQMTHAMLFTGVDIHSHRYRVENSWGDKLGEKGFFVMSDSWFDDYMFEVAIEKKFLSEKILQAAKEKPTVLPPWDPFGSLAS